MKYVHKIGEKEHIETLLFFENIWLSTFLAKLFHSLNEFIYILISERMQNLNYNMFTGVGVFMSEAIHTICVMKYTKTVDSAEDAR